MRLKITIEKEINIWQEKYLARITAGRTKGAGAGGFNRDIENIRHNIQLLKNELKTLGN